MKARPSKSETFALDRLCGVYKLNPEYFKGLKKKAPDMYTQLMDHVARLEKVAGGREEADRRGRARRAAAGRKPQARPVRKAAPAAPQIIALDF